MVSVAGGALSSSLSFYCYSAAATTTGTAKALQLAAARKGHLVMPAVGDASCPAL